MPNPRDDSLNDPATAEPHTHGDTPFGNPNGTTPAAAPTVKYLSLDEVLTSAKRHRTVAHICLRADLQAEYDTLMREIAGMVDGQGRLLPRQPDQALNDADLGALAQEKSDRADAVRREMNASMRDVVFEAMPDDEWPVWYKTHYPTKDVAAAKANGEEPDLRMFNNHLIAKVAITPTFTAEGVQQLRSKLGAPQMAELANNAWLACTTGGVDIPKSPAFLRNLQLG